MNLESMVSDLRSLVNVMEPILRVGMASMAQIKCHLESCDSLYEPSLHARVNIDQYAEKIYENANCFEAWDGGRLIGLIAVYLSDRTSQSCFVTNVSVLEKYHGSGLALDLMKFFITKAVELKCKYIALEVGRKNLKAIHFYEKVGFSVVSCDAEILTMKMVLEG